MAHRRDAHAPDPRRRRLVQAAAAIPLASALPASAPAQTGYRWPAEPTLRVAPGLEGFGTETTAGRGGQVLVVTTLADSGPGSYAEAMATPGPRQVFFDVTGTITMPRRGLRIAEGQVSVYGQTAPGDGIEFRASNEDGFPNTFIQASDVFMQHVRFRTGPGPVTPGGWAARDGLNVGNVNAPISNIVLDHVSASWGTDEIVDFFGATADVTVCNSLFYENLHRSTDNFGTSGRSVFFNDRCRRISFHRCVIALSTGRMPMMQSVFDFDVFNNLLYGYTNSAAEAQVTNAVTVRGNYEQNLFIDVFDSSRAEFVVYPKARGGNGVYQLNVNGNGRQTGGPGSDIGAIRINDSVGGSLVNAAGDDRFTATAVPAPRPPAIPLEDLEERLLAHVGASKPDRDTADRRIVELIRTRGGSLVDCVGGEFATPANEGCEANVPYPTLREGLSRLGNGPDRVPSAWKRAHGLSPDTDTRVTDSNSDGYYDIEDWLASLAP